MAKFAKGLIAKILLTKREANPNWFVVEVAVMKLINVKLLVSQRFYIMSAVTEKSKSVN
ncbi:MAG: hypothetical protein Kow0049_32650 [Stanieria sp.]